MEEARKQFESGDLEGAERRYREILDEDEGNAEAMFMLAVVRQKQGDLEEPLELLDQAARVEPFNPNVFHARAVLHINRGEVEEAESFVHQALEINPNHVASRNALAFVELSRGRFEAAEHAAIQALQEEAENAQAMTYLGTALLERGKVREATAWLQEAVRIEPDSVMAQNQLGRCLLASGNAGFAIQCFENALQATPDSPEVLEYLGRAQLESGHLEEAAESLRKSAAAGRANPELYLALARCEVALGDPDQAEALLAAGLQMKPDHDGIALRYAEMLLARDEADQAIETLESIVEAGTDDPSLFALLARAWLRNGDARAALRVVEPIASDADAPVEAVLACVEALEADGREEEARTMLDGLLEREPPPLAARLFEARRLYRAGDGNALNHLQDLVDEPQLGRVQKIMARHMLADGLHKAGRYVEAANVYAAMANRNAEILTVDHGLWEEGSEDPQTAMDADVTSKWPSEPPSDGYADPTFVIAWPGSGQERVLAALEVHSGLAMLNDQGASQRDRRAHVDRPRGASALNSLGDAQVELARARYWKAARSFVNQVEGQPLMDTMWLTVESLPTIYRVFPHARILVITRDPRDMAVCWMQSGYMNLDIMAQAYKRQLALLEECKTSVPLNYIDVDYDRIEAEPEQAFRSVVSALGLDWDPAVLERYRETPMPVIAESGDWKHYAGTAQSPVSETPGSDAVH